MFVVNSRHLVLARIKTPKKSYKKSESAVSNTLLMSGFQIFAADAAFQNRALHDVFMNSTTNNALSFPDFCQKACPRHVERVGVVPNLFIPVIEVLGCPNVGARSGKTAKDSFSLSVANFATAVSFWDRHLLQVMIAVESSQGIDDFDNKGTGSVISTGQKLCNECKARRVDAETPWGFDRGAGRAGTEDDDRARGNVCTISGHASAQI